MEIRVEQLSSLSGVSVDTIRYYQQKGLLDPPRREGRVAWYDTSHVDRLARVRALQQRGFTLATIARLVSGELDAADEALIGELSGNGPAVGRRAPRSGDDRVGRTASAATASPTASTTAATAATTSAATSPTASTSPTAEPGGAAAPADRDPQASPGADRARTYTLEELAGVTGVPLALLKALEAEQLLIPRRIGTEERYTDDDVASSRAGLLLLEWGVPLSDLLDLARRHHEATVAVAAEAVSLFSTHVRGPLRSGTTRPSSTAGPVEEDDAAARLLEAYQALLPAVTSLVGHHFERTLVRAALDHVDQLGSAAERRAVWDELARATPSSTPSSTTATTPTTTSDATAPVAAATSGRGSPTPTVHGTEGGRP
jgi:DNA-binding transcriptional MerR regulator